MESLFFEKHVFTILVCFAVAILLLLLIVIWRLKKIFKRVVDIHFEQRLAHPPLRLLQEEKVEIWP